MKTSRLIIAVPSLFFVITAASAQAPPAGTSLLTNSVFQKNCAKYHGKTAAGRHFGGPSLISRTVATSPDHMRNIITNGKGHMPKYANKLTSEEIDTLVLQIRALSKK